MSKADRIPHTGAENDPEAQAAATGREDMLQPAGPAFDWQVLLVRYLPQPVGSTHVIKRLAPR
jgi:hypothetical protein